jgi:hypothetical protein
MEFQQALTKLHLRVCEFVKSYKIKLLNSSTYYARANGHAKSSNRTSISLIKNKIYDHSKHWHKVLSDALWAHRISEHRVTKVSPFKLVYGQEAVLHVEVRLNVLRFVRHNDLTVDDYYRSNCSRSHLITHQCLLSFPS